MIFLSQRKSGFTLVELTVILSIVAILATVILGNLSDGRKKARDAQRMSDLGQLQVAYKMYKVTGGSAPVTLSDFNNTTYLSSVITAPAGGVYTFEKSSSSCGSNTILYTTAELPNTSNWIAVCGGTVSDNKYVVILK